MRNGRKRLPAAWTAASRQAHALFVIILGEFNDQNGVLGGKLDRGEKADLKIDVTGKTSR